MAQVLERWRDRGEYRRLCELAATVPLVPDAAAAARELYEAIKRLLDREVRSRRLESLIQKARVDHLDDAEIPGTSSTATVGPKCRYGPLGEPGCSPAGDISSSRACGSCR